MSLIFLRTAWMKNYNGVTSEDIPQGAGAYVDQNQDGGEVYNFKNIGGYYYGFCRIKNGNNLNISRLDKNVEDQLSDVTVVLFARNPTLGGQYIVGWYNHATIYRNVQKIKSGRRGNKNFYLFKCKSKDGFLIPLDNRKFDIPNDGPGQSNAWYVQEYNDSKFIKKVTDYIKNKGRLQISKPKANRNKWKIDIEKRKNIELFAMDRISDYFSERGFIISYVQDLKKGWDLEAQKKSQLFQLEVKGISNDFKTIELTHNEYTQSIAYKKTYKICVVSNCLSSFGYQIDIYAFDQNAKKWTNETGKTLNILKLTSARLSTT